MGRDADPVDTNRCVKEGVIVIDQYKLASDLKTTCLPEYNYDPAVLASDSTDKQSIFTMGLNEASDQSTSPSCSPAGR